jgi:hypothetical protein
MGNYVAQLFSWVCNFTPIQISLFWQLTVKRSGRVGAGNTISEKWGSHLLCQPRIAAQLLENGGKIEPYTYSVTNQYLKKFSYGFWDNQWFGRNQIYLKLKLGALQFMPGIKNLNLIFLKCFLNFKTKVATNKK